MSDLSNLRLKQIAENVRRWPTGNFDSSVTKLELIEEILDLRSRVLVLGVPDTSLSAIHWSEA